MNSQQAIKTKNFMTILNGKKRPSIYGKCWMVTKKKQFYCHLIECTKVNPIKLNVNLIIQQIMLQIVWTKTDSNTKKTSIFCERWHKPDGKRKNLSTLWILFGRKHFQQSQRFCNFSVLLRIKSDTLWDICVSHMLKTTWTVSKEFKRCRRALVSFSLKTQKGNAKKTPRETNVTFDLKQRNERFTEERALSFLSDCLTRHSIQFIDMRCEQHSKIRNAHWSCVKYEWKKRLCDKVAFENSQKSDRSIEVRGKLSGSKSFVCDVVSHSKLQNICKNEWLLGEEEEDKNPYILWCIYDYASSLFCSFICFTIGSWLRASLARARLNWCVFFQMRVLFYDTQSIA